MGLALRALGLTTTLRRGQIGGEYSRLFQIIYFDLFIFFAAPGVCSSKRSGSPKQHDAILKRSPFLRVNKISANAKVCNQGTMKT